MPFVINHSRKEAAPPPAPHICAYLRFCERVRQRAPKCCHKRRRGKPRAEPTANVGFLFPLTTLSYHSTRKKDFTERFFAKRSGERFKRGVRRSRTARKVCSAATTSVREKSVNPFTAIFSGTAPCSSFRTRRPLRACPCRRWCRRRRPPRDRGR